MLGVDAPDEVVDGLGAGAEAAAVLLAAVLHPLHAAPEQRPDVVPPLRQTVQPHHCHHHSHQLAGFRARKYINFFKLHHYCCSSGVPCLVESA